ncbi:MAG: deoxynucleoside kinase [bacterium]
MRQIIAIEGIVHAGKSSLISAMEKDRSMTSVQYIAEYCNFIGGGQNFPGFPKNTRTALEANVFFGDLERKRFATVTKKVNLIILDRSIFSVLAYHYATEKISHGKIKCFKRSIEYFQKQFPEFLPETCLYLAINLNEMRRRHGDTGFYENILLNDEFNCYLMEFYLKVGELFPEIKVITIDGKQDRKTVLLQAKQQLTTTATN